MSKATLTKDEALTLLRRVCEHLLEHGKINEGTANSAWLFEAAKALGAFDKRASDVADPTDPAFVKDQAGK